MWEENTVFSYRGSGSIDKSRKQFSLANLDMVMQYPCHGNDTFGAVFQCHIVYSFCFGHKQPYQLTQLQNTCKGKG